MAGALLCAGSTKVSSSDTGAATIFARFLVGATDPSESELCPSVSAISRGRLIELSALVLCFAFFWFAEDFVLTFVA